jgi:hypothetical protein
LNDDEAKGGFAKHVEAQTKKNHMMLSERAGEGVGILCIMLVIYFFDLHQTSSTGFFTPKFGLVEMFFFYAPILFGAGIAAARGILGRRNTIRPLDVFGAVLSTVALIWLYIVFPFDFSHLADVLPRFLRFTVQWVSNDIVRFFMMMGIIVTPLTAIYTSVLYVFVRRELKS